MNSDTAATGFTLVLCAIGLAVAAFILATPAKGSSLCLTKREARELWPRQHIYWFSKDHCWSNRRGPPRGIRIDPIKTKALAAEPKKEESKTKKSDKLVSAPLDSRESLQIEKDYCCWPDLAQLEREVFAEHWKRLKGWLEYRP